MTAGERTKQRILGMGVQLWAVDPAIVSARRIAKELNINHATVLYHFNRGERTLKDAIAYYAVEQGDARAIKWLIVAKHKAVAHFDEVQRLAYLRD